MVHARLAKPARLAVGLLVGLALFVGVALASRGGQAGSSPSVEYAREVEYWSLTLPERHQLSDLGEAPDYGQSIIAQFNDGSGRPWP